MKDTVQYIDDIQDDMLKSMLEVKAISMLDFDLNNLEPENFKAIYKELIEHFQNKSEEKTFSEFLSETVQVIKDYAPEWKKRGGSGEEIDFLAEVVETLQEVDKALEQGMTVPLIEDMDGLYHYVKEYSVEQAVKNNNYVAKKLGVEGQSLTLVPEEIMDAVVLGGEDIDKAAEKAEAILSPEIKPESFDEKLKQIQEKEEKERLERENPDYQFISPEMQREQELEGRNQQSSLKPR